MTQSKVSPKQQSYAVTLLKNSPPLFIVFIAVCAAYIIHVTAPSAAIKPSSEQVVNVNVIDVEQQTYTPSYTAYGNVIAKNTLTLTAQVDARLNYLAANLIEGGILNVGDPAFSQDPADLRSLVAQRQAEVSIAKAQLLLELGQQRIAEKDYQMMQGDFDEKEWQLDLELLLRKPQLSHSKAQLDIAENALAIAQRDLKRSQWNSNKRYIVSSKNVSEGDYLLKGDEIAKLVDSSVLRVPIYLPREVANKVTVGQQVSLFQPDTQRTVNAQITHRLPVLTANVQLQKVFAEYQVSADDSNPLIIGDFVEATLQFPTINNTLTVPLSAVDNKQIWLVTAQQTLKQQPVTLLYQDDSTAVIINSLEPGDKIIANKMHAPQAGLSVNIAENL